MRDGKAVSSEDVNLLPGGDFEKWKGDNPIGWDYVDGPGKSAFADAEVKHGGARSLRFETLQGWQFRRQRSRHEKDCRQTVAAISPQLVAAHMRVAPVGDLHVAVMGAGGHELNYAFLGAEAYSRLEAAARRFQQPRQ